MKKMLILSLVCVFFALTALGCGKVDCGDSHSIVIDEAVTPDCIKTGLTEGQHCGICGLVLVEQQTLPVKHDYKDVLENKKISLKCKICGDKPSEKFSAGLEIKADEENGTCVVTGTGECKETEISIPPVISGYSVVGIEKRAFSGGRKITSIKVPEGVLTIGNYAFANCSRLERITLPNSVTTMGTHTFYECSKLKSINIPEGVSTIGTGTFFSCSSLTSIIIPTGVKKIGMQCFASTGLNRVFYKGTADEWSGITLDYGNGPLNTAVQYYYSAEDPSDVGNYWRDVDGVAKIWR